MTDELVSTLVLWQSVSTLPTFQMIKNFCQKPTALRVFQVSWNPQRW